MHRYQWVRGQPTALREAIKQRVGYRQCRFQETFPEHCRGHYYLREERLVMSKVFVIDTNKQPLTPVHPGRARMLLTQGKAAVFRRYPFTIVLKVEVVHPKQESLRIKLDPGSKTTGIALVSDATGEVVFGAELAHRGDTIKKRLDDCRAVRRSRRHRKTRYRQARFDNRRRQEGWLPPSLESRISNILTCVQRLSRMCPVHAISLELVRFDTQLMHHPERAGTQYQQGTLQGYEVRQARKVATHLCLLWEAERAAPGRAHPPTRQRWHGARE